MQRLSATEAISPAWDHTKALLFERKSWRVWLKVGLVAFFAQVSGCNFNVPGRGLGHARGLTPSILGPLLVFAILFAFLGLAVALGLFYLNSRLQFVFFEMVLRRDTIVGPIWRRYGRATWYWMGLKVLFFLVAILCTAPLLVPPILHLIHSIPSFTAGVKPNFFVLFKLILSFFLSILAAVLIISAGYRLLYDFGLPSMALEGTSLGETVRRIFQLIRMEPGQVLLYLVTYFFLGLAMGIFNIFVMALSLVVAFIPLGGAGAVLWFSLRHAGVLGYVVIGLGCGVLGLVYLAFFFAVVLAIIAYQQTFLQSYALHFLGGRYPLLGEYLQPTPPTPPAPGPVVPTPSAEAETPAAAPDDPPAGPPTLPVEGEP